MFRGQAHMVLLSYAAVLIASMAIALTDWRRGWYAVVVCGVLQDPVRKIVPGTPAAISMSVIAVYGVLLFAAVATLYRNRLEFEQRFPDIFAKVTTMLVFLLLAAMNGLTTFGLGAWQAPALSLLIYMLPIPAILFGYSWLRREEQIVTFFVFYSLFTSVALIGTVLEYWRVRWPVLGVVAMPGDWIRFLPGMEVRVLSGLYRAPDIMAWHAATLACIGIGMAVRARYFSRAWPWFAIAAWGVLNCLISGRRKAVYMVTIFTLAFLWRYFRRLNSVQLISSLLLALTIGLVATELGSGEKTRVYTRGAFTTRSEVFTRIEGGFIGSLQQSGILGAGLGAATQGVRHVTGRTDDFGWQEGGLGKLTVELGLPGLAVAAILGLAILRMMVRITAIGDVQGTSQLVRVLLFAMIVANIGNFLASAQAYSDPLLTLMTAFLAGCLFATSKLDESEEAVTTNTPAPLRAARAA